ncbi:MAG: hypothetical protein M1812_007861 [Candelaria pacifica]|nr:MAG: hypothetical protein M1812_007861 [Candelaria pacifica]
MTSSQSQGRLLQTSIETLAECATPATPTLSLEEQEAQLLKELKDAQQVNRIASLREQLAIAKTGRDIDSLIERRGFPVQMIPNSRANSRRGFKDDEDDADGRDELTIKRESEHRILYARGYLKGEPQNAWYRREETGRGRETITWAEFKEFLHNKLKPAHIRAINVQRKYKAARQQSSQKVQQFIAYFNSLEIQMEPYTESQRMNHLLQALREDITVQLHQRATEPQTREELITAAINIEAGITTSKFAAAASKKGDCNRHA